MQHKTEAHLPHRRLLDSQTASTNTYSESLPVTRSEMRKPVCSLTGMSYWKRVVKRISAPLRIRKLASLYVEMKQVILILYLSVTHGCKLRLSAGAQTCYKAASFGSIIKERSAVRVIVQRYITYHVTSVV